MRCPHRAGAIYVQQFVEAFDRHFAAQPDRRVEVITLAAAVSFDRVTQGFDVYKRRVSELRLFGLSDKRERGYWEVPGIYNKSLLYIGKRSTKDVGRGRQHMLCS
jgi:hypothetical protein